MKNIIYTLAFAALLSGCKKSDSDSDFKSKEIYYAADVTVVEAAANAPITDSSESELPPPPPPNFESDENSESATIAPKIIKNANLRFQSDVIDKTATMVQELVKKFKGNIQSDLQEHNDYSLSRNMDVRIPSANFDAFIAELSKGVDYYDTKEISSQDVTEEFVDVSARIKTKKELETRYYELLKKANKVSEMLEIEQKLSEIREEIEAKQGRLKYLQTKVSMSTVNISFYKEVARGTSERQSFSSKILASLETGFNSISTFLLVVLNNWPLILIFVIAFIFIRKKLKKRKHNV